MNITKQTFRGVITALVIVALGCSQRISEGGEEVRKRAIEATLQSGDLIFRRGTGVVGRAVCSVDNEGLYSHVGIAVQINGEWRVIHAVPGESDFDGDFDRVKCDPLERFIDHNRAARGAVYRPLVEQQSISRVVSGAVRLSEKRVRFDHDYNLEDTSRLYCTELVEYLYSLEGISISEGRRTDITFPSFSGRHIMPSDLTKSSKLKPIYSF